MAVKSKKIDLLKVLFITLLLVFYPLGELTRISFGDVAVTFVDFTIGLIVLIWLFSKVLNHEKVRGKLFKPIAIFVSVLIFSLAVNTNKLNLSEVGISASYILRWIVYASMYFVVKDLDLNFKKGLPYFMIAGGALIVGGGFIQYFLYPDLRNFYYLGWDEHLYRMFGSFLDPNFVGAFFVLYLIFSLTFYMNLKNSLKFKHFLTVIILLTLISIILTFSRSAYIMLAITLLTLFILKKNIKVFLGIILTFVVGIILLSKMVLFSEGTNLLRIASAEARLDSVKNALTIFKDNPVLGVGFNSYRYAQRRYGFVNEDKMLVHSAAGTDNSFLFILATSGLIGLSAFLYLLYNISNLSYSKIKKNYFALVLFVSIISLGVNSLFINSLFFPQLMLWIWIVAGLTENT